MMPCLGTVLIYHIIDKIIQIAIYIQNKNIKASKIETHLQIISSSIKEH